MEDIACEFTIQDRSPFRAVVAFSFLNRFLFCGIGLTMLRFSQSINMGCLIRYYQMLDWLGRPFRSVPRQPVSPLRVAISRKLKAVVEAKYRKAGVGKGRYIVIHGIKSDSKASMQSRGDSDSLLPIEVWAEIADFIRY